jgi:hypothetical protein
MQDRELRESLLAIGPIVPALEYEGELIDGRRRVPLCEELSIPIERRTLHTLHEACSALYSLHPARALELARKNSERSSVLELARICGTTAAAVALHLKDARPKPPRKRRRTTDVPIRKLKTQPMVKVLVTMEPELKAYAQEAANGRGHGNVNKLIRDAIWRVVALEVPQAPLHPPRRVLPPHRPRKVG